MNIHILSSQFQRPTHPYLQLDALLVSEHCLHFEIDAHRRDERRRERVVRIAEQETGFTDAGVADDQQLEHVVEVLVCGVLLPFRVAAASHLYRCVVVVGGMEQGNGGVKSIVM